MRKAWPDFCGALQDARRDRAEVYQLRAAGARDGLAYACGYLAGQRGMAAAFGHPEVGPLDLDACPPFKANAESNGFHQ
jgi:hypothetical protein